MTQEIKKPEDPLVYPSNLYEKQLGITLRDMFANSAMQSIVLRQRYNVNDDYIHWESVAKDAYELADAMLEQREQLKNK